MKCPRCDAFSRVLDTRDKGDGITGRRRECANGHKFTTFEAVAPEAAVRGWVRKALSGSVGAAVRVAPARRAQALDMLAAGRPHRVVARALNLSTKTIQRIVHHAGK